MTSPAKQPDVFLSHVRRDHAVADRIARRLLKARMNVSLYQHPTTEGPLLDSVWTAIHECDAFVGLLTTTSYRSPNLALELGAAMGRQKPIYVVTYRLKRERIPGFLSRFPHYRFTDVRSLITDIRHPPEDLSEADVETLARIYLRFGVPTDGLLRDARSLERITAAFTKATRKNLSPERLLQEMITRRKRGQWPRIGGWTGMGVAD